VYLDWVEIQNEGVAVSVPWLAGKGHRKGKRKTAGRKCKLEFNDEARYI
jgi:hypothetical protein